ncbi:PQQ-dependent sugar dehydrogenase [Nocardioides flavescens]|uniref:PQQ-dependent sugar dehydrogenase n=1 Tax=Nocardioides flavescens TaxID=2691959 RepID=UPI001926E658|nr:PQQ-dependent sugar dehydrogenase [Nocardioides flavescens]
MRTAIAGVVVALVAPMTVASLAQGGAQAAGPGTERSAQTQTQAQTARRAKVPKLRIKAVAQGLDHPWDARPLPGGAVLFTQRDRATLSVLKGGKVRTVAFPSSEVWVSGETGLMGLEVDPDFASNRRIYTCQGGTTAGGGHDVRVLAWTLDERLRTATAAGQVVGGIPATSGRHGGCRLLIDRAGSLLVGTGDAAVGTNPEDLDSLGGKTLRVDRFTGAGWPGNPFVAAGGNRSLVHTWGHRNVQGLAQRRDGSLWSGEQGSYRDDEVNLLKSGGDYGWNPVPGYDESVPMTDQSLPGEQRGARWRSGPSTLATSGIGFVPTTRAWRALRGTLAVACLKATRVLFLRFDDRGRLRSERAPEALRAYGRIRTVVPDGTSLLVLTDNGAGNDRILRVSPR